MGFYRKKLASPKLMLDKDGNLKTGKDYELITKQASRKRCDLPKLIDRYLRTGQMPQTIGKPRFYGDFTNNVNLQEQIDTVRSANAKFMSLPADLRAKFKNNPAELVKFCSNSANLIEARKLGLANLVTPTDTHNQFGEEIPSSKRVNPSADPAKGPVDGTK